MGSYFAKTLILKDYEERRYPGVNQACIEVEYKMPEQEEEVGEEDSDEEEGSFKKVSEWLESAIRHVNNCTTNEADMKLYNDIQMRKKLSKYISGVNKKGQEMGRQGEYIIPVAGRTWSIVTMKREKVDRLHLFNSQC